MKVGISCSKCGLLKLPEHLPFLPPPSVHPWLCLYAGHYLLSFISSLTNLWLFYSVSKIKILSVDCEGDGITLVLRSSERFTGKIFVKTQSRNKYCSQDYSLSDGPSYRFKAFFEHCDVKKEPNNTFSVIVVIQKHPLFITDTAVAYNLKCTYPTGETMVAGHFNVSQLETHESFVEEAPIGQCGLRIVLPQSGEPLTSATIGQLVQIQLSVRPGGKIIQNLNLNLHF